MRKKQINISSFYLTLLAAIYFITVLNYPFWHKSYDLLDIANFSNIIFFIVIYVFLIICLNQILSLFTVKYIAKFLLIFLILTASIANYFMVTYGVILDNGMLANVLATDVNETTELLSYNLFLHIVIYGLIPILFVFKVNINYGTVFNEIKTKLLTLLLTVSVLGFISIFYYQDLPRYLNQNRYLGHMIIPTNYIVSTIKEVKSKYFNEREFVSFAKNSKKGKSWNKTERKLLTILVLGESARTTNFSLSGYSHNNTTPLLAQEKDVINFNNFYSCATSTFYSMPCIFSKLGRVDFEKSNDKKEYDNLLDITQFVGIDTLWRDNNAGAYGIDKRLKHKQINDVWRYKTDPKYKDEISYICEHPKCYDEILLLGLDDYFANLKNDTVLVLHQYGSHGGAYHLRYPKNFNKFTPICSNGVSNCNKDEIVNVYDNTILYNDYNLSLIMNLLKKHSDKLDTAMFYFSDHGESLGENGLYSHGTPYDIAPIEQKHIPFLFWLSNSVKQRFSINSACLSAKANDKLSHDNLFHSILGFLDIQNSEYNKELDIFNNCIN